MAKIVGGIATSHTPTIGFALDAGKQDDPVWSPIFKGYEPVQAWLKEKAPDALFYILNDHMTSSSSITIRILPLASAKLFRLQMKAADRAMSPP